MRDTVRILQSYHQAAGVVAPATRRVAIDDLGHADLGDGYTQRQAAVARTVAVAPGVTCRFSDAHNSTSDGLRIFTDLMLADSEQIRAVLQAQQRQPEGNIHFDPVFNAHAVTGPAVPGLLTALRLAGEQPGQHVCARLAAIITRGPRQQADEG